MCVIQYPNYTLLAGVKCFERIISKIEYERLKRWLKQLLSLQMVIFRYAT
nr:MAG TPA: hypothetical protein [Caudoviricetes sp.]